MRYLSMLALMACTPPWVDTYDSVYSDYTWDTASYATTPQFTSRTYTELSTVYGESIGAAFAADNTFWAGMYGASCRFDTMGYVSTDVDTVEGSPERVSDVDEVVVITDPEGDEVVTLTPLGEPVNRRLVPGTIEAKDDGKGEAVVLVDDPENGCAVAFHDDRVRTLVRVPLHPCAELGGFTFDREAGIAWVGTTEGVYAVSRQGVTELPLSADLLAWDHALKQLYVAVAKGRTVSAVSPDGTTLWTQEPGGRVRRLREMGSRGAVAVATSTPDGHAVVVLDGQSGEPIGEVQTTEDIVELAASADGTTLLIGTPGYTTLFK
jgi:hypothetical protein